MSSASDLVVKKKRYRHRKGELHKKTPRSLRTLDTFTLSTAAIYGRPEGASEAQPGAAGGSTCGRGGVADLSQDGDFVPAPVPVVGEVGPVIQDASVSSVSQSSLSAGNSSSSSSESSSTSGAATAAHTPIASEAEAEEDEDVGYGEDEEWDTFLKKFECIR